MDDSSTTLPDRSVATSEPENANPVSAHDAELRLHRDVYPRDQASPSVSITVTLMLFVVVLLLIRFIVPRIVEEVQYGLTRGQQRAEYELAGDRLAGDPLAGLSQASQLVSQRIAPSVVNINTKRNSTSVPQGESSHLFGSPQRQEIVGQGSGVVIDASGEILTNYHVISGAGEIIVTLSDDRRARAKVIGVDPVTDMAVLKIRATGLTAAEWGDSNELREGALVWAVGSPFGLNNTVTFGILSAKDRRGFDGERYQEFLQSDAAVSPGNSGGPLVDVNGRVVGINTAIIGPTYQGVSFAIPSSIARDVYDRLRTEGNVPRGWLGVNIEAISPQHALQAGLAAPAGALVTALIGSPARRAGLKPGDIIMHWDGRQVDSPTTLSRLVAKTEVGAEVNVIVSRRGREQSLQVRVGELPLQYYQ